MNLGKLAGYAIISVIIAAIVLLISKDQIIAGTAFLVLLAVLVLFGPAIEKRQKETREKRLSEFEGTLKKHGFRRFTRGGMPMPEILWPFPGWNGVYRGREFTILMFAPGGFGENDALRIITPNRSGRAVTVVLNNKEQMEAYGLGAAYERLGKVGMLEKIWRSGRGSHALVNMAANAAGAGPWALFSIDGKEARYILPGSILNEQSLQASLDIICDTMDGLGV